MNLLKNLILPKSSWKIHASLCIHRVIDSGALDSMIRLLHWPNPRVSFSRTTGDAMIDRARSQEATMFYKQTDADILLFLDDDISYKPEQIVRMCKEAYERKTIVCGPYVNKREEFTWITSKPLDGEPIFFKEDGGLLEIKWGATGCMAIHRNVFTDLLQESDKYPLHDPNHFPLLHPTDLNYYNFFKPFEWQHKNGDFINLSEDWAFCEKAARVGYKIYLDTSVQLGHAGRYVYELSDLCREPRPEAKVIKYIDPSSKETSKDFGKHEISAV